MAEESKKKDTEKKIPPVAKRLVYWFNCEGIPLFVDQHGESHMLVNGEAVPVSRANRFLTQLLYECERGNVPTNDGLVGAKRVLDMLAHRDGEVRELHTRAAFCEGAVYYLLGPGRVAKVDENGWKLDPNPPVTFRSVKNLRPLPTPEEGGELGDVTKRVNLKTDRDKRLFLTYITLIALAHIPRPILQATGVMGSGKTTVTRFVKRLMDPTNTEAVTMDRRDFLQKAAHCYVMMLDNQNSLPEWALDTLCRLVTGESDSKRVLYTDDEDLVWSMKRGVLLNGINPPSERGDVQDRTLPIELERIDTRERFAEDDFWLQFSLDHPRLLGAVFSALSGALASRHNVELAKRPRLADWGLYAAALYESQGWGVQQFMEDWQGVEETQQQGTLDGSIVAQAIIIYMKDKDFVEKPPGKLHTLLETFCENDLNLKSDRGWPKTGQTLWRRIREVSPLLEAHGIRASRSASNKAGKPIILDKRAQPDPDKGDGMGDGMWDGMGDGNHRGDAKGDANCDVPSPDNPHGNGKGDGNTPGGWNFGVTISSDRKEGNKNTTRNNTEPESVPDFASPPSPGVFVEEEEDLQERYDRLLDAVTASLEDEKNDEDDGDWGEPF
jgi:hypothetical protein